MKSLWANVLHFSLSPFSYTIVLCWQSCCLLSCCCLHFRVWDELHTYTRSRMLTPWHWNPHTLHKAHIPPATPQILTYRHTPPPQLCAAQAHFLSLLFFTHTHMHSYIHIHNHLLTHVFMIARSFFWQPLVDKKKLGDMVTPVLLYNSHSTIPLPSQVCATHVHSLIVHTITHTCSILSSELSLAWGPRPLTPERPPVHAHVNRDMLTLKLLHCRWAPKSLFWPPLICLSPLQIFF